MPIKHAKVSAKADGADATLVQPSDWNGDHVVDQFLDLPDISTPAVPAAGSLRLFTRMRAGRSLLAMIGPNGVDVNLQPALFGNSVTMWTPSTGTTVSANFGSSWVARNTGTGAAQAHPARSATNSLTSLVRATFGTGSTTTGASGIQSALNIAWRGTRAGEGGWFFFSRFAVETFSANVRLFVGLSTRNAVLSADPSTFNHSVGLCKDAADTQWHILTRGTVATKTPLPVPLTVAAGTILDFVMFAPPNGANIRFALRNAVTGEVYADDVTVTATLPDSAQFMYAHASIQTTNTPTGNILALNRIYVETDL